MLNKDRNKRAGVMEILNCDFLMPETPRVPSSALPDMFSQPLLHPSDDPNEETCSNDDALKK